MQKRYLSGPTQTVLGFDRHGDVVELEVPAGQESTRLGPRSRPAQPALLEQARRTS